MIPDDMTHDGTLHFENCSPTSVCTSSRNKPDLTGLGEQTCQSTYQASRQLTETKDFMMRVAAARVEQGNGAWEPSQIQNQDFVMEAFRESR